MVRITCFVYLTLFFPLLVSCAKKDDNSSKKSSEFSLSLRILDGSSNGAEHVSIGTCNILSAELVDDAGGIFMAPEDTTVDIVVDGPASSYSDSACTSTTKSVVIPKNNNASNVDLYLKNTEAGEIAITANSKKASKSATLTITSN